VVHFSPLAMELAKQELLTVVMELGMEGERWHEMMMSDDVLGTEIWKDRCHSGHSQPP